MDIILNEVSLSCFLTREQLQERLIALHQASLELVKDVSLETLLERIATVACEQSDARYAALGVLDDEGKLIKFISVGMTEKEIKRMSHPPVGRGLIGALMDAERTVAHSGDWQASQVGWLPSASSADEIIFRCADPCG